jgi:hypothetical protein
MNTKGKNYKKYLKAKTRLREVWDAQRELGYEPLEEPYQKGWDAYWVLRLDVSRRSDADDLQYILDHYGCDIWHHNISFVKWDHDLKRYVSVNPHIRSISEREWDSLPSGCKKWFKVLPDFHGHYHPWYYSNTYTCVIPHHFLVKEIEPSMVTHTKVIDSELEREESELLYLCDEYSGNRSWWAYGDKSAKDYRTYRNRQFRRKEKREINKAMRNGDWDEMDLPTPKKQVLWDMY